jgi:hypothetical protein
VGALSPTRLGGAAAFKVCQQKSKGCNRVACTCGARFSYVCQRQTSTKPTLTSAATRLARRAAGAVYGDGNDA